MTKSNPKKARPADQPRPIKESIKNYYSLTKPGVLYGNVLTAVAGFLLAANGRFDLGLFLALLFGITFVIGSACALNNYLDKDIDSIMERTQKRAVPSGAIKGYRAVLFSAVLGIVGIALLALFTNWLTVAVAAAGFVVYVLLYGMLSKRLSIHGTLVGSISGAAPILAGYTAVSNELDAGAILVFVILFLWQMPEFYSIAIYRRDEYKAAGVPVMTVVKGIKNTKIQILLYTIAFVVATLLLTAYGVTGYVYLVIMGVLGAYWIWLGAKGIKTTDDDRWSRQMFRFSLIMLLVFSGLISVDAWLV